MHAPSARPARLVAWTLFALASLTAIHSLAKPGDNQPRPTSVTGATEDGSPGPLLLDALLEPLAPEQRPTEAEEDRLEALARFSAGRTLEWKQQYAQALRHYQRAARYDPKATAVAQAAVRLAVKLDRLDEAARSARKLPTADMLSPLVWMKLGLHLAKKGDWEQAVRMYQNALAARKDAPPTVGDVALKLELGRLYYLLGEYPKSADSFARVCEALDNPQQFGLDEAARKDLLAQPASMYVLMGNCFLHSHRPDEAAAAFQESHRVQPNEGVLAYHLARVEAENGQPDEALAKLQTYFDKHLASEGVAPYRLLARILEDLGKQTELTDRLEKLYAGDRENVPLGYFLAETYHQAEQFGEAESLYRELVKKTPTITGYRALVAICRQTNRLEALLDVLGEAADQGVAPESFGEQGHSITEDAELVGTLIEIAQERQQDAPDQFGYGLRLATALLALDARRFDAADRFFDLALQADPDQASETLLTWGLGLLAQEQYGAAVRVFRRGIDEKILAADNPVFYFYLSGALELDGRTEEALAAARKSVELDPNKPRFLSRVAWILYRSGQHREAIAAYTRLIEKFDSDFSSGEVRQEVREARMVLSNLAVLADDLDQAERWLEEVLDEFPDDIGALNDLGYLWADRSVHLERAQRMIRQAVEGDPHNLAYRDSLGWILYRLGRLEEAVAELEKAAQGDQKPDPVILDHLGDAYHAAGQPDKAKQAWGRALEAFEEAENTKMAKTVQQKLSDNP